MTMRAAFQGEPGAYSEAAVFEFFSQTDVSAVPCESFEKVFQAVKNGDCQFGVLPIENSLAGSIHQNYDLLMQNPLWVVGEHYLRVSHCLIARPGSTLADIKTVMSHPQALAQCAQYLKSLPGVKVEPVYDTAGSVKIIRSQNDPTLAAIASVQAARIFGMQVLAEHIEDNQANFTRFLVVANEAVHPVENAKTSIVFTLKNEPGSLYQAMREFATRGIDLCKIESRPLVGTPWDYLFYLDLMGSTENESVKQALQNLQGFAPMLRILGSYPSKKPAANLNQIS
ncbi:prephenate dehydratase [Leptolinea tardivitalis]|uniref:Prephenate dehydratase n=1 Tax=Leptolinea tardivitalis TaxID=229920 RepID=A0A0P6XDF4_9CHLR|nr:prephenate dehydratase [Leptolinea tardivitalis]KPL73213.1 prephenate dehydratase [Leptolinea tardivitalis]GAP21316.1 prephenate dehydratase [Leptolinea tardivitalis]